MGFVLAVFVLHNGFKDCCILFLVLGNKAVFVQKSAWPVDVGLFCKFVCKVKGGAEHSITASNSGEGLVQARCAGKLTHVDIIMCTLQKSRCIM